MTVSAATFRAVFSEFADTAAYPAPAIDYWLTLAGKMMDAARWGDLLDHGTSLFVAHRLALQSRNTRDAQFGKTPGAAFGPVSSKGVDKVNISFDTASAAEENAGFWNLTTYGQEYIRLARIVGMGPVQIGLPSAEVQEYYGGFYAGPYLG